MNQITLEELLCLPPEAISAYTGWTVAMTWYEQIGVFTRRGYRITSPDGTRVFNVKIKSWNMGGGQYKDSYKVSNIGRDLPGSYVLQLT